MGAHNYTMEIPTQQLAVSEWMPTYNYQVQIPLAMLKRLTDFQIMYP